MIEYISGTLVEKAQNYVIVECAGFGIYLRITSHTYEILPDVGENVKILTELAIKDDGIELYGFHSETERELFRLITTVPGVGDRLAISILSTLSVGEFVNAIKGGVVDIFSKVPSLGRKRAERLINELRGKVDKFKPVGEIVDFALLDDALSAMLSLGYKKSEARAVLEDILKSEPSLSLEELLRKALPLLSKK